MSETADPALVRTEALAWLGARGKESKSLEPLTGDVSPRSYFRVVLEGGESVILATYPPWMATSYHRFLETTELLSEVRVPVPAVLEKDPEQRFMLLQDLGRRSLFELDPAPWPERIPHFETALDLAARIRDLDPRRVAPLNPHLDAAALEMELEQTWRTYLHPQGMARGKGLRRSLEAGLSELCRRLGQAPLEPCHRDFMARNLMPIEGSGPPQADSAGLAVLDHQDLRLGPVAYDVASLLNDSLFPPAAVEAALLKRSGAPELDYRRAAVQRTLKAVGTYAAFAERGARRHLPLIRPTLRRTLFHMRQLPELEGLAQRLTKDWNA